MHMYTYVYIYIYTYMCHVALSQGESRCASVLHSCLEPGLGSSTHFGIKYNSSKSNTLLFQISIKIQVNFSDKNTLQFLIQIQYKYMHFIILLHIGGNLASYVLAQNVYPPGTTGFFEAHSQSLPGVMAMAGDKRRWLPIHPSILMFDQQLQCRLFFTPSCPLLTPPQL